MGHAGPKTDQCVDSDWPQKHGHEDSEREPSLVPSHSGRGGIGQPLQSAHCGQSGLEGVERIAGLGGILLYLAGDLVKECLEFPRAWWQTIGFVALTRDGPSRNLK